MGLEQTNFILANINAFMGSAASALENQQKGTDLGTSLFDFGRHALNGTVRNIVARDIYESTGGDRFGGSYIGYLANTAAGYGTDEADAQGMSNLLGASMLTQMSPFGFGYGMSPFGCGIFGGGYMGYPMGGMMSGPTSYTEINITTTGGCCGHHHRHFRC